MKKYIDKVTVTGASDDTSYDDMVAIQKEYPFVEWGILLSRSQAGRSWRFPSMEWLQKSQWNNTQLNMSGHLCGKFVNEILMGNRENVDLRWNLNWHFKRIQINTHGIRHKWDGDKFYSEIIQKYPNTEFIFQYDKENFFAEWLHRIYGASNISTLYDLSHGAGVLPSEWDKPLKGIYTGYAGGLSPDNLEEQLSKLDEVITDEIIWIDAETHLRSNGDQIFDLDKVIKFLEIAKSRVINL